MYRKIKNHAFFVVCIVFVYTLVAQQTLYSQQPNFIDSLRERLQSVKHDTNRINISNEIAIAFSENRNFDSAHIYIDIAIQLAKKNNNKILIANSTNIKGKLYRREGKFEKSLDTHLKALEIATEYNNEELLMNISNNLGVTYRRLSDDANALKYHLKALDLSEKLNDLRNLAVANNSIGIIYTYQKNYTKSMPYFEKAYEIEQKRNNLTGVAINLNSIAWIYELTKEYDKAIKHYKLSLDINQQSNNKKGIAICYSDLGKVYHTVGEYEKSLLFYKKSLKFNETIGDKRYIARNHIYLGEVYAAIGDSKKSLEELKTGLDLAYHINSKRIISIGLEQMSDTYENLKDYKTGFLYYKKYIVYKDSIMDEEKSIQIIKLQTRYETDQKEKENSLLKNKNSFNEAVIQKQKLAVFAVILILFLTIILAYVLYRSRQKHIKSVLLLRDQNEEIITQKEEIQKQAKELEKANNTLNRFFSIIAHDLKNPFHTIIGFSRLLKSGIKTQDKKTIEKYVDAINTTSTQTHELLLNLLEWSLSQTNTIKYKPQQFDITEIINKNITLLINQAREKEINMVFNSSDAVEVYADYEMINTVTRNIITNAIKYTSHGEIIITSEKTSGFCNVAIADSGIGISKENLENLFKIDKIISTKGTSGEMGSGLGLILCAEFINKNHGEITVESEENKGSKFSFTLPLAKK